jgi:hypothetical protein
MGNSSKLLINVVSTMVPKLLFKALPKRDVVGYPSGSPGYVTKQDHRRRDRP